MDDYMGANVLMGLFFIPIILVHQFEFLIRQIMIRDLGTLKSESVD